MKHITHKEFDEEIRKEMDPEQVKPDRNMRKEILDKANQFKQVKNG